jgi:hypothetical protein
MPRATLTELAFTRDQRTRDESLARSGVSGIVANVIPQPILIFEQQAKPDGDLPVLIALVSRRKRTRIAQ